MEHSKELHLGRHHDTYVDSRRHSGSTTLSITTLRIMFTIQPSEECFTGILSVVIPSIITGNSVMLSVIMPSVIIPSIKMLKCHYIECSYSFAMLSFVILSYIMLSFVMLISITLSAIMLRDDILNVVAPNLRMVQLSMLTPATTSTLV
jgi:hypothetical protein